MLFLYFNFAGGRAIRFGGLGSGERNGAIWWQGEGSDQPIFSGHMATVSGQPSGHVQMAGGSGEAAGADGRPYTSGKLELVVTEFFVQSPCLQIFKFPQRIT